jgi:hypothetical protein
VRKTHGKAHRNAKSAPQKRLKGGTKWKINAVEWHELFEYLDGIKFQARDERENEAGERQETKREDQTWIRNSEPLQRVWRTAWCVTI